MKSAPLDSHWFVAYKHIVDFDDISFLKPDAGAIEQEKVFLPMMKTTLHNLYIIYQQKLCRIKQQR